MPLLVTASDVSIYVELVRRLSAAAEAVELVSVNVAGLVPQESWAGVGAAAAADEARRLARRLVTSSGHLREILQRARRKLQSVALELAHRHAHERTVLHALGRVATLPGELEQRSRALLGDGSPEHGLTSRLLTDPLRRASQESLARLPRQLRVLLP